MKDSNVEEFVAAKNTNGLLNRLPLLPVKGGRICSNHYRRKVTVFGHSILRRRSSQLMQVRVQITTINKWFMHRLL